MSEINKSKKEEKNEEVQLEKKIDQEALDVVFRLYDLLSIHQWSRLCNE